MLFVVWFSCFISGLLDGVNCCLLYLVMLGLVCYRFTCICRFGYFGLLMYVCLDYVRGL